MKIVFSIIMILILLNSCSRIGGDTTSKKIDYKKNRLELDEENEKSKRITEVLMQNHSIDKAIVVIQDDTALIGVILKRNVDNENNFKEEIMKSVIKMEPGLKTVQITTEEEMYNRIQKLKLDIQKDKPIRGMIEEIFNKNNK